MNEIINITKSAEEYLSKLLTEKNEIDLSVRIFISDPGTPKAETCLAYCKPDEAGEDDVILNLELEMLEKVILNGQCLEKSLIKLFMKQS